VKQKENITDGSFASVNAVDNLLLKWFRFSTESNILSKWRISTVKVPGIGTPLSLP